MGTNTIGGNVMPVVSKMYCSPSQVVLVVRRRPQVVHGGGLVVTRDCSQNVAFKVDGCGMMGKQGEVMVRDGGGEPLLLIRKKGGMVEAVSFNKYWRGYALSYVGANNLLFRVKEPNSSCFLKSNSPITISTEPKLYGTIRDFEVKGFFKDRDCCIVDSIGNIIAQVDVKKEVKEVMLTSKDLYHVIVKPGIDQAFIVGVIAVLDYIYDGTTKC